MRALILGLSALIIGLAVAIVLEVNSRSTPSRRAGAVFRPALLIADALPGEEAVYREQQGRGRTRTFAVTGIVPAAGGTQVPVVNIRQTTRDPRLPEARRAEVSYGHRVTDHFWFPLTNPRAPEAKDRIWILSRIREDTLLHQGKERACWRIDLIDPALPKNQEHVVAYVDRTVPVFGLLQWQRGGETWVLESSRGKN